MYTFGAIMYCVLASGDIQPWAKDLNAAEVELKTSNSNIYNPKNGNIVLEPMLCEQEENFDSKSKGAGDPMLDASHRRESEEIV